MFFLIENIYFNRNYKIRVCGKDPILIDKKRYFLDTTGDTLIFLFISRLINNSVFFFIVFFITGFIIFQYSRLQNSTRAQLLFYKWGEINLKKTLKKIYSKRAY